MKKQAESVTKEYDRLLEEHAKLQVPSLPFPLYQSTRSNDQISSFVCAFFVKMWRDGDSIGCAELHFKTQLWHTVHVVAVHSDLDSCNFSLSPSSYFFLSSACVLRRSCVGAHQKGLISFCLHFLHSALLFFFSLPLSPCSFLFSCHSYHSHMSCAFHMALNKPNPNHFFLHPHHPPSLFSEKAGCGGRLRGGKERQLNSVKLHYLLTQVCKLDERHHCAVASLRWSLTCTQIPLDQWLLASA